MGRTERIARSPPEVLRAVFTIQALVRRLAEPRRFAWSDAAAVHAVTAGPAVRCIAARFAAGIVGAARAAEARGWVTSEAGFSR